MLHFLMELMVPTIQKYRKQARKKYLLKTDKKTTIREIPVISKKNQKMEHKHRKQNYLNYLKQKEN